MQYLIQIFNEPQPLLYNTLVVQLYESHKRLLVNTSVNLDLFLKAIIVTDEDEVCGHCIVYKNDDLRLEGKTCLAIGNWECIENDEVAKLLLDECNTIAKSIQITNIVGPMNGSTWDNYRFIKSIIGSQYFLGETPCKPYYIEQWLNNGYRILANYISASDTKLELYQPQKMSAYKANLVNYNITIRNIDLQNFETEIENIFDFCETSFTSNYLYTAITKKHFVEKYSALKKFLIADYIFIAEQYGKVVAFLFAYPDVMCTTHKQMILKTVANAPTRHNAGLTYILTNMLIEKCIEHSYTKVIHAFMHIQNISTIASNKYDGEIVRQYVLLIKDVV